MGIEESYNNAFDLLVGNTDWDKLSEKGSFMLPIDYEDTDALLKHFESIEDYEKCAELLKLKNKTFKNV